MSAAVRQPQRLLRQRPTASLTGLGGPCGREGAGGPPLFPDPQAPVFPGARLPSPGPVEPEAGLPALSPELRPYQVVAVQDALADERRRILVVMPTGSGKSIVLGELARVLSLGGSVLVVTHRKELVQQDVMALEALIGQSVGVWSAGLKRKTVAKVTVGSIQSMVNMPIERVPTDVCAVIVDEAHRVRTGGQFRRLFDRITQWAGAGGSSSA